jgi:putative endopeptidase
MIGAVIGHEITHGFDDQGRRYDADGNLRDWWTEEDAAEFAARAQVVIDQFDAYEALPGFFINGTLTQGENIADLGGVSIAFEALQRALDRDGRPGLIDGFTPEQRFFIAWAQGWRTAYREEALRRQLIVGPHAPGQFRAVGPLVNLAEFHAAFGIQPGDPMWLDPAERAKIW